MILAQVFGDIWPFLPYLMLAGICAGFLAGLFGIGGGLVIVPALYALFTFKGLPATSAMAMALSTSLAVIVPTALSSLLAHRRLGNLRWDLVKNWWPGLVLGVLLGGALIGQLRSRYFIIYFGAFLAVVAIHTLTPRKRLPINPRLPSLLVQRALGFVLGFMSVIAGVGGGALGVPMLQALGLAVHQAVGTCAAFGFLIALPGSLVLAFFSVAPASAPVGTFGLVYLPALVCLAPLTALCAPWGAKWGKKLSPSVLSRLFGGVLLLIALNMISNGIRA